MPSSKVSGNMAARTLWDLVWFNCWFISKKQRNQFSLQTAKNTNITLVFLLKSIYSEKASKLCEISTLLLTALHTVKSKVEISQNFVAFSEYLNLKSHRSYLFQTKILRAKNIKDSKLVKLRNSLRQSNQSCTKIRQIKVCQSIDEYGLRNSNQNQTNWRNNSDSTFEVWNPIKINLMSSVAIARSPIQSRNAERPTPGNNLWSLNYLQYSIKLPTVI